ncbi:hypothetical protein [Candidatus Cyanaurora vandensis]|uniref:hypothetical protein n=1 Tax=Candidatus Cyanaurora vandensis TaxID=2714958 RepID=UPI0025794CF6|nr:hypothetical protein [Candidatus Cyanaurora vandensis]
MDELSPILRALTDHPLSFARGFLSGLFRLSANEEPVKDWLVEQMKGGQARPSEPSHNGDSNGRGPQRIAID